MPSAIKRHRLVTLKPRVQELPPRLKTLTGRPKTLKQEQAATGRTLALNGAAWRRLRALVLAEQPLCRDCDREGRLVVATEVDHQDNDPSNNSRDNLVGLCKPHHSRKTNADMGHAVRYGCDVNGWPLDPSHPWQAAQKAGKSPATGDDEPVGTPHARRRT